MAMKLLVTTALALAIAPLAFAHDPAGTPKNYCEPLGEWNVHDYGAPATGALIFGHEDGNLGGDCSGNTVLNPGGPCVYEDPNSPIGSGLGLCDSEIDPPLADWDFHSEFAFGGAWILVDSGNGEPSWDPGVGAGTLYCYGAEGHHAAFGPVSVTDFVLGAGATFSVYADTEDITMAGDGCGDFEEDNGTDCVGSCTLTFPPGLDGSYVVYVQGTSGHVVW
jgi:hypothetical protein